MRKFYLFGLVLPFLLLSTFIVSSNQSLLGAGQALAAETEAESSPESVELCLHFFYREDCSQCQSLMEEGFFKDLESEYKIEIKRHDIEEEEGDQMYEKFKETYGLASGAHPIVFLGEEYFIGESAIRNNLEGQIIDCQDEDCICPVENIDGVTPSVPRSSDLTPEEKQTVEVPLVGEVDLSDTPLFFSTALISFVDGFNPCSLWLVSFLLGIVIHTGSRKKIFLVGTTFLLVTTAVYGLFIAGLLNVFSYIGYLPWIQVGVAILALLFALVNIKDYFWYKEGISFTISDKYKPKIFKDMRGIMKGQKSTWAMMVGTAGLALGVVLVELPCTAGFPVVWTSLLSQYQVATSTFLLLLLLYLLIYMLDEMGVVIVATWTLRAGKFEEKHGRLLKLIGGVIMVALASVMLIDPDLMNNIGTTLLVFGSAIVVSILIAFIHRRFFPQLGTKFKEDKELGSEGNLEKSEQ